MTALYGEVLHLHTHHEIFWTMQKILRENPKLDQFPGDFNYYVKGWYETSMALAIRRQAEDDKRVVSFRQLLEEIKNHPTAISRDRYKQNFVDSRFSEDRADKVFNRLVGEGRQHIDPAAVQSEIDELVKRSIKIKEYVDRQIAHRDKKVVSAVPNHNDIDEALNYLGELLTRYWSIFRCEGLGTVTPVFQYDWTEIFTLPWIDNDSSIKP
jgi:HEPN superfamily AbiU2-like protein